MNGSKLAIGMILLAHLAISEARPRPPRRK